MKIRKKESSDYLSNKQMLEEIVTCQEKGKISDKLGKMFVLLATHYATKPNFSGYSYKDEFVASGILACCVAFPKFDKKKSDNPFAYFTQVIHHAFLQTLNKEKNSQNIRDSLLIEHNMNPSFGYSSDKEMEGVYNSDDIIYTDSE